MNAAVITIRVIACCWTAGKVRNAFNAKPTLYAALGSEMRFCPMIHIFGQKSYAYTQTSSVLCAVSPFFLNPIVPNTVLPAPEKSVVGEKPKGCTNTT